MSDNSTSSRLQTNRFIEQFDPAKQVYGFVDCEKATFLPLTLTHPAIQYKGSKHEQSSKVDLNYSKILQQTLEIYNTHNAFLSIQARR